MENFEELLDEKDDQITLKQVINKLKDAFNLIRKNFIKFILVSFLGLTAGFIFAYISIPSYSAKVKFLMKESSGGSGLLNSLGSLGSLLGGGGATSSPLDRTVAILGSEKIIGDALFKTGIVDNKSDLIINHLIRVLEYHQKWEEDTLINKLFFNKKIVGINDLNKAESKALRNILADLTNDKVSIIKRSYEKKSGVFELIINTNNESFSIEFSKVLYKELELFMYNQSISASGKNVIIFTNKIDSIKSALNNVQNALARNSDRTLGLLMQEDKVELKKLMMKEQVLTLMYGEAQKNLETLKFVNESTNTGFEVIEYPFSPIKPNVKNKIFYSIFGFILFGFLYFIFIYVRSRL